MPTRHVPQDAETHRATETPPPTRVCALAVASCRHRDHPGTVSPAQSAARMGVLIREGLHVNMCVGRCVEYGFTVD